MHVVCVRVGVVCVVHVCLAVFVSPSDRSGARALPFPPWSWFVSVGVSVNSLSLLGGCGCGWCCREGERESRVRQSGQVCKCK